MLLLTRDISLLNNEDLGGKRLLYFFYHLQEITMVRLQKREIER